MPIDAVVFDLDGVVWHEFVGLDGAAEAIAALGSRGYEVAFLTNTSSRTPAFLNRRLRKIGVGISADRIFTAGRIAAEFIAAQHQGSHAVIVHGERGVLLQQVTGTGLPAVSLRAVDRDASLLPQDVPLVVALGSARTLTTADVMGLLTLAPRVSHLYATDRDRSYATAAGPRPGGGWVVAAAEEVLGQKATVLGKPNPIGLQVVAGFLGVDIARILMVGDSPTSDVAAAHAAGAVACLFDPAGRDAAPSSAKGAPSYRGNVDSPVVPDHVIGRLRELVPLVLNASIDAAEPLRRRS